MQKILNFCFNKVKMQLEKKWALIWFLMKTAATKNVFLQDLKELVQQIKIDFYPIVSCFINKL